jgi:K+-transporting ATPase ATPase C chain
MLRQLRPALVAVLVFTVLTGLMYPVVVTAIAQVAFDDQANGSPITVDGEVRGSELIAQPFAGDEWFHPRPSAVGWTADNSGGSNLGQTDPELLSAITERAVAYRESNGLPAQAAVPIDAVTASGSGLDPHISPRNARIQAERVASARDLPLGEVLDLVDEHTEGRTASVLGEPRVNVVTLNAALEQLRNSS